MAKKYQSIRIFKSDALERFTHVHPITPLVLWVPVIAYLFYLSSAIDHLSGSEVIRWAAAGFFIWTLFEYVLHRFIFHWTAQSPLQERIVYLMHGLHHDDPVDPTRLVMPPAAGLFLAVILFCIFRLVLGPLIIHGFFGGFLVGYLCYDYIHYAVHHFTPRTRIGKYLKQSHMTHHYVSHNARWGVSSPIWDYVFGTVVENKTDVKRVRHGS